MPYKIEICVGSATQAIEAQQAGADRVELCAALQAGGLTPSAGEIMAARRGLTATALHVIIRPRQGDFLYSPIEIDTMAYDIEACRKAGADGVVTGCLTPNGDIDISAMQRLVMAAGQMSITFHRAFDMCRAPLEALDQLIALGCHRVLTSGCQPTAVEGADMLARLVEMAGDKITIMPGCGINPDNIAQIAMKTKASEFHFSANKMAESGMRYRNATVSMGGNGTIDEYAVPVCDKEKIVKARKALDNLL